MEFASKRCSTGWRQHRFSSNDAATLDQMVEKALAPLSFIPTLIFTTEVLYEKFLNRLHDVELGLASQGLWNVPHPWLNLFVPRSSIAGLRRSTLSSLSPHDQRQLQQPYPHLSSQKKKVGRQVCRGLLPRVGMFKSDKEHNEPWRAGSCTSVNNGRLSLAGNTSTTQISFSLRARTYSREYELRCTIHLLQLLCELVVATEVTSCVKTGNQRCQKLAEAWQPFEILMMMTEATYRRPQTTRMRRVMNVPREFGVSFWKESCLIDGATSRPWLRKGEQHMVQRFDRVGPRDTILQ